MAGFRIPPHNHPAREAMGDLHHVAEILRPSNIALLKPMPEAIAWTKRNWPKGVKAINVIIIRGDDERWLIRIGPRGGWRKLWNFGTGHD